MNPHELEPADQQIDFSHLGDDNDYSVDAMERAHEAFEDTTLAKRSLQPGFIKASAIAEVVYGPEESHEGLKKRVNDAANALRPHQPRDLTQAEESRVDSLMDGSGVSYDVAINQVVDGGQKELDGDKAFEFDDRDVLELAKEVVQATQVSELSHFGQRVAHVSNELHKQGKQNIAPQDVDELDRLRKYKLPHLKKTK
jgi:hypothetical protein